MVLEDQVIATEGRYRDLWKVDKSNGHLHAVQQSAQTDDLLSTRWDRRNSTVCETDVIYLRKIAG